MNLLRNLVRYSATKSTTKKLRFLDKNTEKEIFREREMREKRERE